MPEFGKTTTQQCEWLNSPTWNGGQLYKGQHARLAAGQQHNPSFHAAKELDNKKRGLYVLTLNGNLLHRIIQTL